jgi:GGDEF domain-containing protein
VHEDIAEQLRMERRLVQEAMFDAETELPNRNLLRRRLVDAIARANRSGRAMAVLSVELAMREGDGEHAAGLLSQVAGRLHGVLRQVDLLARTTESGFTMVVEDLGTPALAVYPAVRILESLEAPLVAGGTGGIDARIGVAIYPGDGESPEILLTQAMSAASAAGSRGTSRIRFVDRATGVTAARLVRPHR